MLGGAGWWWAEFIGLSVEPFYSRIKNKAKTQQKSKHSWQSQSADLTSHRAINEPISPLPRTEFHEENKIAEVAGCWGEGRNTGRRLWGADGYALGAEPACPTGSVLRFPGSCCGKKTAWGHQAPRQGEV